MSAIDVNEAFYHEWLFPWRRQQLTLRPKAQAAKSNRPKTTFSRSCSRHRITIHVGLSSCSSHWTSPRASSLSWLSVLRDWSISLLNWHVHTDNWQHYQHSFELLISTINHSFWELSFLYLCICTLAGNFSNDWIRKSLLWGTERITYLCTLNILTSTLAIVLTFWCLLNLLLQHGRVGFSSVHCKHSLEHIPFSCNFHKYLSLRTACNETIFLSIWKQKIILLLLKV